MWKAQFLVDLGEGHLSMDSLKQLDAADENLIADVFNMFVKSQGTESLPAEAQDRRVLAIVMEERVKQVGGETVSAWAQRAIAVQDGVAKINLRAGAAYTMIFEHDRVTKIHHRSGETADIPEWVVITKGFQLQNPFNDQKAAVARDGITPLLLSSFFEKTAACHANAFDKKGSKMKALFDAAVATTEAEKNAKMTEITATSTEGFVDHAKVKRQAALAKARANMQHRAPGRRRVLKLSQPPAPLQS